MNEELLELARLGVDAETFLRTDLGKFLQKKAADEYAAALIELVNAAPDDLKTNTEARNKIHVVGMFTTWLRDSIEVGISAHAQLEAEAD